MNSLLETISNKSTDQYKIIEAKLNYLVDYLYYVINKQDGVIEGEAFDLICYTLNISPTDHQKRGATKDE